MAASLDYTTLGRITQIPSRTSPSSTRGNNNYWIPSTQGSLKLNVDAHPSGDGRWGLGIVMRTEEGKCVGATTKVVRGSDDILEGEARGLQAALDFLETHKAISITIEMDSSTLVDSVQKKRN
ncbi:hypothetical protein TSUD_169130 [Trifolium subterraneum]|nr:hypothetical protein TSUD_169130 [Trifolium subterraneum]